MGDWDDDNATASYSSFSIDHENAGYQLHLGEFTGGSAGAVYKLSFFSMTLWIYVT